MMEIDLGATIRRIREERGIAQSKLARMADLPNNTLIRIETGAVTNPSLETVKKIAAALGMEPYELLKPPALPIAGRRRSQRGLAATGTMARVASSMLLLLALPGMTRWATPIIHRSSSRNSLRPVR